MTKPEGHVARAAYAAIAWRSSRESRALPLPRTRPGSRASPACTVQLLDSRDATAVAMSGPRDHKCSGRSAGPDDIEVTAWGGRVGEEERRVKRVNRVRQVET